MNKRVLKVIDYINENRINLKFVEAERMLYTLFITNDLTYEQHKELVKQLSNNDTNKEVLPAWI